ncbi:MAG TPA: hypothetical protein EYO99_00400, partial [Candidatus Marinimicrobia bacterium]|nr:hypothetical protein [Candidatus Neomarinimicrobiota bacterium]
MNKSISYLFIFLFCLSQLNAQGGSVGCGEVIVDQIPFTFDSTTVGGENNVNVSNQGAGDGDDIVFTLNVHDTITIDISLCHSETLYDAQMGVYILDETCTIDTILPTCRYPLEPLGGAQVDCFAEDTWACTYASAAVPDSADIGVDQAHYRPIIYEYELFPYEGQDTTAYYIVVDGWNGVTGNFRITIEYSQAPYIVSTELHEENDWIDLTLNESVFSNEFPWDNQAPIDLGDLTIDFNQNDGYVTEVVIDEITKTNGNPLEGGELTVRVHLNVFNEPPVAGSETIEIGPINSSTLYDGGGTSMQDTSTSGVDTLNQSQCFDQELTEADFPFNRVTDLSITSNNWDFLSFPGIPDDPDFLDPNIGNQGGINQRNGNDYAYKLTLTEPRTIYVTTCDDSTTLDVQIAIFNDCDMSTWIFYQDDSHWYIVYPDGTWEEYQFQCISGLIQLPTIANMLPRIELEAGDYYVVVDDRQTLIQGSTVGTWIGYSLLVDSTNISESLNSIDYYFNQEVYGGDYPDVYAGNGIGLEISDFEITIEPNGGNATLAEFTSITNLLDNPLSGGEEAIRLNIDYNEPPSGSEVVIIKPASVHSVFNVIGVPLLDTTGIEINLVDQVPPSLSFNPDVGDTISPTANIEIIFSERVYLIGGINPDDADIGGFFDLSYGGSNPESIDFDATINNNDS